METVQIIIEAGMLVALGIIAANTSTIARKTGEGGNEGKGTPPPQVNASKEDEEN